MLSAFLSSCSLHFFLPHIHMPEMVLSLTLSLYPIKIKVMINNMASHSSTQTMLASLMLGVLLFISVLIAVL